MAKKMAIVVASLVVIAACAWWVWPRTPQVPDEALARPHVCEACGHRFRAMPGPEAACPQCQKRDGVVLYHEYVCKKCGERFEAFREREVSAPDQPPRMEYKRPGGQWLPSAESLGEIACPKCKSAEVAPRKPETVAE